MSALLTRWRQAGLVGPTVLALAGLAVLIGLGTWQMKRKAWKEGLLAQIADRVKAEPVSISEVLRRWQDSGDVEYLHVRLAGRFQQDRERHVFAVDDRLGPGFHVYTPLETPDKQLVLVNRGFVPAPLEDPATRSAGQVAGDVTLTGLVRRPTPRTAFVPESEPARNRFYWPDYSGMLQTSGGRNGDLTAVPFFVDADAEPPNPGGIPRGGVTRLVLPNRHFEYALTWYGLALTLVGVFAAYARSRLRGSDQDTAWGGGLR